MVLMVLLNIERMKILSTWDDGMCFFQCLNAKMMWLSTETLHVLDSSRLFPVLAVFLICKEGSSCSNVISGAPVLSSIVKRNLWTVKLVKLYLVKVYLVKLYQWRQKKWIHVVNTTDRFATDIAIFAEVRHCIILICFFIKSENSVFIFPSIGNPSSTQPKLS